MKYTDIIEETTIQYKCDKCGNKLYDDHVSQCLAYYPYKVFTTGYRCAVCKRDLCDTEQCGYFTSIYMDDKDIDDDRETVYTICYECKEKHSELIKDYFNYSHEIEKLEDQIDALKETELKPILDKIIKLTLDETKNE